MWRSPTRLQLLIRQPSSDHEFACEVFLTDLPGFFNPAFKPNILDPAEMVHFRVLRNGRKLVSYGSPHND